MAKKNIATKQHKLWQNRFASTFLMWRNFTTFSPHDRSFSIFILQRHFSNWQFVMWRISPHDNLSRGKLSPDGRFFSTGTACGACDKYQVCSEGSKFSKLGWERLALFERHAFPCLPERHVPPAQQTKLGQPERIICPFKPRILDPNSKEQQLCEIRNMGYAVQLYNLSRTSICSILPQDI